MRRKFISSMLRIALALVLSVVTIAPAKFTSFAAGTSGTCGEHVSWSIDGSGVVRISGYGPMANYDSADNISPFYQNDSISSVIIEEGVTSIGGAMFANSRVSSISIPESVVEIGSMALSGCTRLTSIELPAKLEKIGENAFAGCLITKVEMPNTVKEIGARAFSDCPFLASVTVPEGVTTIKESTFSGCPRLTDVKLPSTLKTIDFWAFSQDDGLKKIVIPEGVTTIDQGAFGYCPNLEDVTIPFSVTEISSGAFSTCTSLKEIVIPGNVKRLKNTAFYGCTSLEKVTISDAMETIDAGAFGDCPNLKTVVVRGRAKTASDFEVGGNNTAFLNAKFENEPAAVPPIVIPVTGDPFADDFSPAMIEEAIVYPNTTEDPSTLNCKFYHQNGKSYWYENGVRQGTYDDPKGVIGDGTVRGREVCDMETAAWYWCDSVLDGAKAINKEVWMPYIYQDEKSWSDDEIKQNAAASKDEHADMSAQLERDITAHTGKWVRYNANGKMFKGWYKVTSSEAQYYPDQVGNIYYYDPKTGLMAKGDLTIDGVSYHFDDTTGVLKR